MKLLKLIMKKISPWQKEKDSPKNLPFIPYLFLFLLLLFLFSMYNRVLHIDEAILGEQVYWLMKEGKVKSLLYAGLGLGLETELLVYHKLFIWLGTALSFPFGLSLNLLRCISLFFVLALSWSLFLYCKKYLHLPQQAIRQTFMLILVLLLSNSLFFAFGFIFRPEMMLAFLGFSCFYFLAEFHKQKSYLRLSVAALLAGAAALTHLNGLIFISAGILLLITKREVKASFLFVTLAGLCCSLYFIDMWGPGEMEVFLHQFSGAPAFEESDLQLLNRLERVLDEYKRYFHSHIEISFTIMLLLIVGFRFQYLWKRHSLLMWFTFYAAGTLTIINQGQTSKYALLLLPFAAVLMADGLRSLSASKPKTGRWMLGAFALYLIIQLHAIWLMFQKSHDLEERNALMAQHIPEGSRVYAPASFLFNQVQHYELRSFQSFKTLVHRFKKLAITRQDFFNHTRTMGSEYIVLDLLYMGTDVKKNILGEESLQEGKIYYGYKVLQAENNYIILRQLSQ